MKNGGAIVDGKHEEDDEIGVDYNFDACSRTHPGCQVDQASSWLKPSSWRPGMTFAMKLFPGSVSSEGVIFIVAFIVNWRMGKSNLQPLWIAILCRKTTANNYWVNLQQTRRGHTDATSYSFIVIIFLVDYNL